MAIALDFTLSAEQEAAVTYLAAQANATPKAYLLDRLKDVLRDYVRAYRADNPPTVTALKATIPADLDPAKVARIAAILAEA